MIASLRTLHRGSFTLLAVVLPLGLAWAVAGRTTLPIGEASSIAAGPESTANLPRIPGTHLGARAGVLVVEHSQRSAVRVFVEAPTAAQSGDVVLYASRIEPALKSDLPAGARWLGPQLRRGAPVSYEIELENDEAFVVAYDLSIATVVGHYRLDARAER
jgi:hypothetical protein